MHFYKAIMIGVLSALTATTATAGGDFDPSFDPAPAVDINPDPNIFEINLVAAPIMWQYIPGINTASFAYNGQIPGPLIDVELGQTLRVNFTNNLGEDTTIHWHGVDAPADMDGSHISQLNIPDGGTFTYEFELLTPGLKWYHPHVRTDVMVEHGLYGPIIVRDVAAETALNLLGHEHIVMFDDIRIDEVTGIIDTFDVTDPLERVIYQTSGRTGNVLLVNGKRATDIELNVPNGEPQRWYNWNVSNSVFARLDVNEFYAETPGVIGVSPYQVPGEQFQGKVWKVGGDRGLLATREQRVRVVEVLPVIDHFIFEDFRAILLVPGERMDVIFTPSGRNGAELPVDQWDWARGDHVAFYKPDGTIGLGDDPEDGFKDTERYFSMRLFGEDPGGPYYEPPTNLDPNNIEILDIADVTKTVNVTFGHSTPDAAGNVNFFAVVDGGNPMPFPMLTSLVAADLEIGDVVQWNVKNLSHGDHPFHTHGFAFQWFETEYFDAVTPEFNFFEFPNQITNKDTILVPARTGAKGSSNTTLRALMSIDDTGREGRLTAQGRWPTANTSGGYLFHCHILEHVTRGMMGFFEVFDPTDPFANLGGATANLSGGHSYLGGTGLVTAGTPLTIDLQDSIPGAASFLAVGATETLVPLTLGYFLPTPTLLIGPNMPDAMGNINKNFVWPAGLPAGTEIFWQWATFETVDDVSVSNALRTKQL